MAFDTTDRFSRNQKRASAELHAEYEERSM